VSDENASLIDPYIPQLQLSLFYSQQVIIIGSLFCMMFYHRFENTMNPSDHLSFSIEERTVYFLLTFTIAKGCILFSVLFPSCYAFLYILASFLSLIGISQITYVLMCMLGWLYQQTGPSFLNFTSHHQFGDFYHILAILVFVITDFVILTLSQRLLDINPTITPSYSYSSLYLKEFLVIQILLTYFLTVIPGRSYLLHANIQKDKLNTRLNLIRYVSHEMRTPLNTAFLGLAMLLTDLKEISKKYQEKVNNLKENVNKKSTTVAATVPSTKLIKGHHHQGSIRNLHTSNSNSSPGKKDNNIGKVS
jgi:signal transduction histidine kinase